MGLSTDEKLALLKEKVQTNDVDVSRVYDTTNPLREKKTYSSRYSSKGSLIKESVSMFNLLKEDLHIKDIRNEALYGNLFLNKAYHTRRRIWHILYHRYIKSKPQWVIDYPLKNFNIEIGSKEFISYLYLHYALRDKFTFDYITETLYNKYTSQDLFITKNDVFDFFDIKKIEYPNIDNWSFSTKKRLSSSLLTSLRDFGILEGVNKKKILKPIFQVELAPHIIQIMKYEYKSDNDIINDDIWKLFLLDKTEAQDILHQVSKMDIITFKKFNDVCEIKYNEDWEGFNGIP